MEGVPPGAGDGERASTPATWTPGEATASFFFRQLERTGLIPGPDLAPGTLIDDYRLVAPIGQGGMGQVWEARQISLGDRRVALKLLLPERVGTRQLDYFEREARALGRLRHPGLVTVHASGRTEGLAWIAMEHVDGSRTLRDFLDETSRLEELPAEYDARVAELVAQIAEAMQAAHAAGVIHRDLKPQNVLVTPEDRPKVGDFGLARITDEPSLSRTGDFAGTYLYMSPEQVAAGRAGIDARTDVFSLGAVLYELLTLRRPFQGDSTHQIAAQILTRDPPDPRTIRSRVPRDLSLIVAKALEKDPERRYPTMAELAGDLRRHLGDETIRARPAPVWLKAAKWARRHPTRSGIALVAAVAFAVISLLLAENVRANRELASVVGELKEERGKLETQSRESEAVRVEAETLSADLLRLSAGRELEELLTRADALWPPHPELLPAYAEWIDDARELLLDLPQHRDRRDELRDEAPLAAADELRAERERHSDFPRLRELQARIAAEERALARRRGGADVALPELDAASLRRPPEALVEHARTLTRPGRSRYGEEPLGLALALLAVERAPDELRATAAEAAARAAFALGRDDECLNWGFEALDAATTDSERARLEERLASYEAETATAREEAGLRAAEQRIAELRAEAAEIEMRLDGLLEWHFADADARWWHGQLEELIAGLEALEDEETGMLSTDGISPTHGWSVPRRQAFARRLEAGFAPGGEYARRWEEALPAMRDLYPAVPIAPVPGLLPIGPDPDSGLWELAHLASGEVPERTINGALSVRDDSCIVLVLIPGGRYLRGARFYDPEKPGFDRLAAQNEGPVGQVELQGFFLAKTELTQGQWLRLAGSNPSYSRADRAGAVAWNLVHPVEQVSWSECVRTLRRYDLTLPTESQWEYAARAGTSTPWWTGAERESLADPPKVNIADRSAKAEFANWPSLLDWPEYEDRYPSHAPVMAFPPSAFGLHEVLGNVAEWCLDGEVMLAYHSSDYLDPFTPPGASRTRVVRGGSYADHADNARCSARNGLPPATADPTVGARPARSLAP